MAGYFGIGVERSKTPANVGTLWRSAAAMGASFIFTIGHRYPPQASDTIKAWRQIPLLTFTDVADFNAHRPYDCQLVGVEIAPEAYDLRGLVHPNRAIYLLGPEDGSLSKAAQDLCQAIVKIDSRHCLNVAVAGSIVMYDRSFGR